MNEKTKNEGNTTSINDQNISIDPIKREEIKKKIRDAFEIYQTDVLLDVEEDFARFVRALGLNPTNAQIQKMREELKNDYLRYEELEPMFTTILYTGKYKGESVTRHTEETILRAFETLDTEKKGYIPTDKLRRMLTTYGEVFDSAEIEEMIEVAEDPENHVIRYADYAHTLANE